MNRDHEILYKNINIVKQELLGKMEKLEKTLLTEIYKEFDETNKLIRKLK